MMSERSIICSLRVALVSSVLATAVSLPAQVISLGPGPNATTTCIGNGPEATLSTPVIIPENTKATVCTGVTRLAIDELVMRQGAILDLPPEARLFELTVRDATIHRRTRISAMSILPHGVKGADLTINFRSTRFNFNEPFTSGLPAPANEEEAAFQTAILGRRAAQNTFVPEDVRFEILSRGAWGESGSPGADGYAAQRKQCAGSSGHPASDGGPGGKGGKGGDGGMIVANIALVPGHPPVSNLDIQLKSEGGAGGPGGPGGAGGRGAPSRNCGFYTRGGWPDGNQGPVGPVGDPGDPSEAVNLNLDFND